MAVVVLQEHWTTLQGEARLQRVMTSLPLRKHNQQRNGGTGPLGRARLQTDAVTS